MPNRNDMSLTNKDAYLSVGNPVSLEMRRLYNDEKLVAVDVDLGNLLPTQGVLHRERMKTEHSLQGLEFVRCR